MQISNICKSIVAGILIFLAPSQASADNRKPDGIRITEPSISRNGTVMSVGMGIEFPKLVIKSTEATVLTPMIVNGLDTLKLPSVSIYGRTSWFMSNRNDRMPLGGNEGAVIRYQKRLDAIAYSQKVRYADWMNGSELIVQRTDYGCAGCSQGTQVSELARYKNIIYEPTFIYQAAVAEPVKTRELSGRAYIDFPVNRIEIYPDYRRNSVELAKITGTIDSVRNDEDITVTSITIKGYASPESPWDNNTRLAKGRTATLKQYVQALYHFPNGFIQTDYEPEDWEGLREYVAGSTLEHRDEILAIIDDPTLAPDPKEWRIKLRYPDDYKILLSTVYPGLRHSDYRIEYNIRTFSDPEEIRELLRTQPQKLSLNEVYLAVQGLEPGSDEYNEVFETAVRLFPSEPTANLNAANAAMQRGDLTSASKYLERAGDSAEATYARGVLSALNKDFARGIALVEEAMSMGLIKDTGILEHMREAAEHSN